MIMPVKMLDDCRLLFRSWSRSLKLESLDLYESGLGIFKNNLVNPSILGKGGGGGGWRLGGVREIACKQLLKSPDSCLCNHSRPGTQDPNSHSHLLPTCEC